MLTGGAGGAKLVPDLRRVLKANDLAAVVNTGDDFRHVSLSVSPDIDTLFYTSAGKANAAQGWGREGETWSFMAALPAGRLDPLSARQLRSDRDERYRGGFSFATKFDFGVCDDLHVERASVGAVPAVGGRGGGQQAGGYHLAWLRAMSWLGNV